MKYKLLVVMNQADHEDLLWLAQLDGRSMNDVIRRLVHDRAAQLASVVAKAQQEAQQ